MKKIFILLTILLFIGKAHKAIGSNHFQPKISRGVLHLKSWDNEKDKLLKLDGSWSFYWNKVIPPNYNDLLQTESGPKVPVPGQWSYFPALGPQYKMIKEKGYGTYLLKLKGLRTQGSLIGLKLSGIRSNFKAYYVDQEKTIFLGQRGVFSTKKETAIPQFKNLVSSFTPSSTEGYLVLHISNFHFRSGGLFNSLKLGHYPSMVRESELEKLRDFFILGVLLIMAAYHYGLYYQRKEDYGSLFFSLFSFVIFFRLIGINSYLNLFFHTPNLMTFEMNQKLSFISVFLAPYFFYGFTKSIIPHFLGQKMLYLGIIVGTIFSLIALFTSAVFYSQTPIILSYEVLTSLYIFYITTSSVKAALKNIRHSRIFLLGLGIIVFGFVYDVLIQQRVLAPPYIFPYTLTLFIFIQGHILAIKFSEAYKKSERLSKDLSKEVEKQTTKIKEQNNELTNLLENLGEGFMVFDNKGIIQEGSSSITKTFFKQKTDKRHFSEILDLSPQNKKHFQKWCYHIWSGKLLFKDLLALAPSLFDKFPGQFIKLDYRPIYKGGHQVDKVICIASDITKERDLEIQAKKEKNQTKMILLILENPHHFLDLIEDTREFLDTTLYKRKIPQSETLFRKIHTLKARFSNLKIRILSDTLHDIEDYLFKNQNYEKGPILDKLEQMEGLLNLFMKDNQQIIRSANLKITTTDSTRQMRSSEVKKFVFDNLQEFLNDFNTKFILRDFSSGLRDFFHLAKEFAEQQDKIIDIYLDNTPIHVDLDKYEGFLSNCIHLFRNAIDHGIEDTKTRKQKNKPENGLIKISFLVTSEKFFQMTFHDDGQGIHPGLVKKAIQKEKLKSEDEIAKLSDEDIIQYIFLPGLSTREDVTGISGRGIGLDALQEETRRLGGKVEVQSKIDEGSTFIFTLPFYI